MDSNKQKEKAADYHFKMGQQMRDLGRYDDAFDSFMEAVKADPSMPEHWHCAGQMAKFIEHPNMEMLLDQAIKIYDPFLPAECFWRGAVYAIKGDIENALNSLKRAIVLSGFGNELRNMAILEEDYQILADNEDFKKLTKNRTDKEIYFEFKEYHTNVVTQNEDVNFREITPNEWECYIATPFLGNYLINVDDIQKPDDEVKEFFDKETFGQYLADNDFILFQNEQKQIVNMVGHADLWDVPLLRVIARYVQNDSYMILADKIGDYWRCDFIQNEIKLYHSPAPEVNHLLDELEAQTDQEKK